MTEQKPGIFNWNYADIQEMLEAISQLVSDIDDQFAAFRPNNEDIERLGLSLYEVKTRLETTKEVQKDRRPNNPFSS